MPPLLHVRNLVKYFPVYKGLWRKEVSQVKAVDGISFKIFPGQIVGLVGESGSGKSTAGRAAIRLLEPTSGQIDFRGQDLLALSSSEMKSLRRSIQMVFQDPFSSLNPRKPIIELIGEGLLYHGLVKNRLQLTEKVVSLLVLVGLSPDSLYRYPHEFSGGQQQRICIARAIAVEPDLIVFDEALASLDVSVQAQTLNLLYHLKEELNLSYLFISHDLGVVRHFCDELLVLYQGKIVESGSAVEIFSNPKHPYTRALLSAIPSIHPRLSKKSHLFDN